MMSKKPNRKAFQTEHDRMLCETTIRCKNEPNFNLEGKQIPAVPLPQMAFDSSNRKLYKPKQCYVCKKHFWDVHTFYHLLCPSCASLNYEKRFETADLTGRVALVTGGRIKIGYEIGLKLLRAGATLHVTTRFKHNAIERYSQEKDFNTWSSKLHVHSLDLKNLLSVEEFVEYLFEKEKSLDILINNACQTIRKSDEYYQLMAKQEAKLLAYSPTPSIKGFQDKSITIFQEKNLAVKEKNVCYDEFNEPLDLASHNSWLSRLETVSTVEMVEAQVINSMAPFILNSKLKPLFINSSFNEKFIINVSSMEGKFNRDKTSFHPHTNMAKASLNMMTRTSAMDYSKNNIYMNAIDTGWVTQEHAFPIKIKNRALGFVPPLDCIDGASRVLAPIFETINHKKPIWGKFLKDYEESAW